MAGSCTAAVNDANSRLEFVLMTSMLTGKQLTRYTVTLIKRWYLLRAWFTYWLLRCGRVEKYCNESICLSVCLSAHISRKPRSRTSPTFARVACGRGSVLLWRRCDAYVFPVLRMTSYFHTLGLMGQNHAGRNAEKKLVVLVECQDY